MKKSVFVIISILLIAFLASACNLFGTSNQPQTVTTPNMTLTALFDTSQNIPPTVTPIYVVVTNTPEAVVVVPTSTTAPAATTAPTTVPPTAVPIMQRSGALMVAGYINFTPTIDGSWSEWKDYTTLYPAATVVYGKSNWSGSADLEASYAAAWDEDYLYLGVKVYDDKYVQNAKGEELYLGDSVEILLDTNLYGDYYTQSLTADDFQLGISAGNSEAGIAKEAYLWFPSGKAGTKSNVTISYTTEDGLYRIEAQIPWSVFGVTPSKGMHLGIAVSASDDDDPSAKKQQTMVSSAPNRHLLDPTTWGEIVLTK